MSSTSGWTTANKWNIFARELEKVLAARALRLGHLDNRDIVHHPEIVRRLQHSLTVPKHFPVLNPDELERLSERMTLTPEEQRRLRAALLATAVERVLMERLAPQMALMAADDVFELCLASMREQPENALNSAVRQGAAQDDDGAQDDPQLHQAFRLIDDATLALYGAHDAITKQARGDAARFAATTFAQALEILRQAPTSGEQRRDQQNWDACIAEAEDGMAAARALLRAQENEQENEQ